MKLSAMVLSLTLLSSPLMAITPEQTDMCGTMGEMAGTIMNSRQTGTPMSDLMRMAEGNALQNLIETIIAGAYNTPRYHTQENIDRSVSEFRASIESICFSEMQSSST